MSEQTNEWMNYISLILLYCVSSNVILLQTLSMKINFIIMFKTAESPINFEKN